jgi:hypothetical protein
MAQCWRTASIGAILLFGLGCVGEPLVQVPNLFPGDKLPEGDNNPVYIPLGAASYGKVYENVLQTVGDYGFELMESNRIAGQIEFMPRIAPGLLLLPKPGSPDLRERLLATLQTYRHRLSVKIEPADMGGYFIHVIARKELQDLPRPVKQTAGAAIFRNLSDVDRRFEVIDPTVFEAGWIYKGRDRALEQQIIQKLKKLM